MVLIISNRPHASHSSDFETTRMITPWIVLHSVKLLLHIMSGYQCDKAVTKNDTREAIW